MIRDNVTDDNFIKADFFFEIKIVFSCGGREGLKQGVV
jgi:hypothetical protein